MSDKIKNSIEHVIVLMLENRSFDHLLGYLKTGHELSGSEFNPTDPADSKSEKVYVSNTSDYITAVNPAHDFEDVKKQMYGKLGQVTDPAPMNGFVNNYTETATGVVETGKKIMECFDPARLPALATLAKEFCLCDNWFSSVPGPTWINRFYVHAATSDGMIEDNAEYDYNMKTIFDSLSENSLSWNVYYGDIPQCIILQHLWEKLDHFKRFEKYHEDIEKGELASYTFIEPRFIDFHEWKATDQHPPHDVKMGEYLIAEVYDTLRSSPYWEKSLLVVLYDEHGGFFDRVAPTKRVPNPDGKNSTNPAFDFTRLGLRVPAVLVSPYIEKGQLDSTIYEHASLPATIKTLFNLPEGLTARDKAANTFEKTLSRVTPRSDAPLTLPVPGDPGEANQNRSLMRTDSVEKWLLGEVNQAEISMLSLSSFQRSLLELAHRLNQKAAGDTTTRLPLIETEHEAAVHILKSLQGFLKH
ncbi:MAG: alkaline phosphatase family protein [Anaerolineaceae bacterium]|nr:alkaline phosphatase family protein [Anaerolineaceae bacterium]